MRTKLKYKINFIFNLRMKLKKNQFIKGKKIKRNEDQNWHKK
jgi:hypothetical protein